MEKQQSRLAIVLVLSLMGHITHEFSMGAPDSACNRMEPGESCDVVTSCAVLGSLRK